LPVLILTAWLVYVETEMPNRANECPYVKELCDEEQHNE
jgi:hypothetical protein